MRITHLFLIVALPAVLSGTSSASANSGIDAGALDNPLPTSLTVTTGRPAAVTLSRLPAAAQVASPAAAIAQLRNDVRQEQRELEKLDRNQLQEKADNGERAAQVVLGADFAKEATMLSFAPAAANDALSDAARYYSLAASRGYPGAPSLDQAGIRFYPIRVHREFRR